MLTCSGASCPGSEPKPPSFVNGWRASDNSLFGTGDPLTIRKLDALIAWRESWLAWRRHHESIKSKWKGMP